MRNISNMREIVHLLPGGVDSLNSRGCMNVSVILCTYNRCKILATALESVAISEVRSSIQWEIIVVDNNSSDETRNVVERVQARFEGRIRYVFEARQGKSHALNSGIQIATGDVLAFVDDDVTVEPTWLQTLTAPLIEGRYMGAGGRICPPQDVFIPRWIALSGDCSLAGVLALFDRGLVPIVLVDPPYGTNMAFRREMFEKVGAFRTDLGPCSGSEIRGEDTEFCLRLMQAGVQLLYVPGAVVYHEVPPNRLTKKYFLTWYYHYGRARIRMRNKAPDFWFIPRAFTGVANHLMAILPGKVFQWLITFGAKERFFAKTQVWMIVGETAEIYNQWMHSKNASKNASPHVLSQE